jgi:chromosome segregation ATPase
MFQLTKDLNSNTLSRATLDGSIWRVAIAAHGGAEHAIPPTVAALVPGLCKAAVASLKDDHTLPELKAVADQISGIGAAISKIRGRQAEIVRERQAAAKAEDILDRLAILDAETARLTATIPQLEGELAKEERVRAGLLQRWNTLVRQVSIAGVVRTAQGEAAKELDAAWAAVEQALAKPLERVAAAAAKVQAIAGPALQQQLTAALDSHLPGSTTTPPAAAVA